MENQCTFQESKYIFYLPNLLDLSLSLASFQLRDFFGKIGSSLHGLEGVASVRLTISFNVTKGTSWSRTIFVPVTVTLHVNLALIEILDLHHFLHLKL